MATRRITKQIVDGATVGSRDYFIWDAELKGFGLRVSSAGKKTYICEYRTAGGRTGRRRRYTLGRHGSPWTAETAREEAKKILGDVAHGLDPARSKQDLKRRMSIAELCDQYLAHGCPTKKPSTLATDRGRILRHIKPVLGTKMVEEITRADVMRFMQDIAQGKTRIDKKTKPRGRAIVRGGKGTASRTVGLLGAIFTYAIHCGIVEHSPVRGVKRFPDRKGMRYLSEKELVALGHALKNPEAIGENAKAVAIIKLLVFTGARRGEIERLKWSEVDLARNFLRFEDSKTGQKIIPINRAAAEILASQTQKPENPFVFHADKSDGFFEGLPKIWRRVRKEAGLEDVRIHDLRHSFASIAVAGGASLPIIGALLGHRDTSTTQRYAHLSDNPLRSASELVARSIARAFATSVAEQQNSTDFDMTS
jgi:integrase